MLSTVVQSSKSTAEHACPSYRFERLFFRPAARISVPPLAALAPMDLTDPTTILFLHHPQLRLRVLLQSGFAECRYFQQQSFKPPAPRPPAPQMATRCDIGLRSDRPCLAK